MSNDSLMCDGAGHALYNTRLTASEPMGPRRRATRERPAVGQRDPPAAQRALGSSTTAYGCHMVRK